MKFTQHARKRCSQRGVPLRDVYQALKLGKEKLLTNLAVSYTLRGLTVIVDFAALKIVTAYRNKAE